jgi:hypothetical protein
LQWGIKISEELGLPIYLETTTSGQGLYEREGFEHVDKVIHTPAVTGRSEDIVVPIMVKMPSQAKGISFKEWQDQKCPELGN